MLLADPADADTYLSPLQRAERQIADELGEQPHKHRDAAADFSPCMHIDDKFVMRACGWAAAALAVMHLAGMLP
jgi:hypothetical protein